MKNLIRKILKESNHDNDLSVNDIVKVNGSFGGKDFHDNIGIVKYLVGDGSVIGIEFTDWNLGHDGRHEYIRVGPYWEFYTKPNYEYTFEKIDIDTEKFFIEESEEDDFEWINDLPEITDLPPGVVYRKFGLKDEHTRSYVVDDILFSDTKLVDGRIILSLDGYCDFNKLFYDDSRGGYGRINKFLAEKVLCDEDDWWEPYSSRDLIHNWKDQIWDVIIKDKNALNAVLEYVKRYVSSVDYNPKQLDIYGELPKKQNVIHIEDKMGNQRSRVLDAEYFTWLTTHLDDLGDLINSNGEFEDLKLETIWAYGDAYNIAARDEIYKSVMRAITEEFGEGKEIGMNKVEFDITEKFWTLVGRQFDICWDGCHRPKDHSEEEYEEYCSECHQIENWSYFIDFYQELNEDLWSPRYDESPDDDKVEEYFIDSILDRI